MFVRARVRVNVRVYAPSVCMNVRMDAFSVCMNVRMDAFSVCMNVRVYAPSVCASVRVHVCMNVRVAALSVCACCHGPRPPRVLVALASEPGTVALEPKDPRARNGHFTGALLQLLASEGATSTDARVLMGDAIQAVEVATECKQTPSVLLSTMHGSTVSFLPQLKGAQ